MSSFAITNIFQGRCSAIISSEFTLLYYISLNIFRDKIEDIGIKFEGIEMKIF